LWINGSRARNALHINRSLICDLGALRLRVRLHRAGAGTRAQIDTGMITHMIEPSEGQAPDHEQKRVALAYLHEAWLEARIEGVDGDCLAQACLFAAFAEFVSTYGEEPAARFAEGLAFRIRKGEFSLVLSRQ
jgi:hypothetical protein